MSRKVLVTGGAGFIGSHLCERLLRIGWPVVCLDDFNDFYDPSIKRGNLASCRTSPLFTLVEGDIRDRELVRDLFRRERPRAVVHLAAMAGVQPSLERPLLYQDVNVRGTGVLLEAAREFPVENFLFGSSSSVYGEQEKVPFREDARTDHPLSPYAATKAAGELLCHAWHHLFGIPITCLRFFTVYGPRQRPDLAIYKFTHLILAGCPLPLYGDGSTRRDYTYIDDIVEGLIKCLEKPFPFQVLNLGGSRTVSLVELVHLLEINLDRQAAIEWHPPRPGDILVTHADICRARELIGYHPSVPIEEGLARFVEWIIRMEGREREVAHGQ